MSIFNTTSKPMTVLLGKTLGVVFPGSDKVFDSQKIEAKIAKCVRERNLLMSTQSQRNTHGGGRFRAQKIAKAERLSYLEKRVELLTSAKQKLENKDILEIQEVAHFFASQLKIWNRRQQERELCITRNKNFCGKIYNIFFGEEKYIVLYEDKDPSIVLFMQEAAKRQLTPSIYSSNEKMVLMDSCNTLLTDLIFEKNARKIGQDLATLHKVASSLWQEAYIKKEGLRLEPQKEANEMIECIKKRCAVGATVITLDHVEELENSLEGGWAMLQRDDSSYAFFPEEALRDGKMRYAEGHIRIIDGGDVIYAPRFFALYCFADGFILSEEAEKEFLKGYFGREITEEDLAYFAHAKTIGEEYKDLMEIHQTMFGFS